MRLIVGSLLIFILAMNLIIMAMLQAQANYITRRQVYDLDLIRSQYENDVRAFMIRGCLNGVDYPPEFRGSPTGFNTHSPDMYCSEYVNNMMIEIDRGIPNLGRKQ